MKKAISVTLARQLPLLSRQWHPTKNGQLTPHELKPFSGRKVWWSCSKGHEWQAVIYNRSYGAGCPYCKNRKTSGDNSLQARFPILARQWHPSRNGSLTPRDVLAGSARTVWWRCSKGHEWEDSVLHRSHGRKCPYCSGRRVGRDNSLQRLQPKLAKQWHPAKNQPLTPEKVTPGSGQKVWWRCGAAHVWLAKIQHRSGGAGCPYCSGRLADEKNSLARIKPLLAAEWHSRKNGALMPAQVKLTSRRVVWWKCRKGHEWQEVICYRAKGRACPICVLKAKAGHLIKKRGLMP